MPAAVSGCPCPFGAAPQAQIICHQPACTACLVEPGHNCLLLHWLALQQQLTDVPLLCIVWQAPGAAGPECQSGFVGYERVSSAVCNADAQVGFHFRGWASAAIWPRQRASVCSDRTDCISSLCVHTQFVLRAVSSGHGNARFDCTCLTAKQSYQQDKSMPSSVEIHAQPACSYPTGGVDFQGLFFTKGWPTKQTGVS